MKRLFASLQRTLPVIIELDTRCVHGPRTNARGPHTVAFCNATFVQIGCACWCSTRRQDGGTIQDELLVITGARSVPRVFVGGALVGGCDDTLDAFASGRLDELLSAAEDAASPKTLEDSFTMTLANVPANPEGRVLPKD